MTSHFPIFVLGMENEFGPEGIQVVEMPGGTPVGAETYSEFANALDAMAASHAFIARVIAETRTGQKPIVYVEGETDAPYLKRAATLLGKSEILAACDIEWIGSKDTNGQGFHTGKDALKHTLSVLKANPNLATRPILLLNDNDTKTPDQNLSNLFVRTLPVNLKNTKAISGIENLLSEDSISDEFYQDRVVNKPNGDTVTSRTIRKTDMCNHLCENGTIDQFAEFDAALRIIAACFMPGSPPDTAE